jgi:plastocyanin
MTGSAQLGHHGVIMTGFRRTTFARLALALTTAAVLVPAPPASAAEQQTVGAFFIDYVPHAVQIRQGDSVTLVDTDPFAGEGHTFTQATYGDVVPKFDSDVTPFGQSSEVRGISDLAVGEYVIHCRIHPSMKGSLFVDPPAPPPTERIPPETP